MGEYDAPALRRGLEIIALLQRIKNASLEELARLTGYPKSSVMRLMEVLQEEGIVCRDPESKAYRLLVGLCPVGEAGFHAQVQSTLRKLAQATGQTAEWYLPCPEGMRIAERYEAPQAETGVRAGIGFVRPWRGELDAVAACAAAFFPQAAQNACTEAVDAYEVYQEPGVRRQIPQAQAERIIATARTNGYYVDQVVNNNHVRRIAAVIMQNEAPCGVIALAEVAAHGTSPITNGLEEVFRRLTTALRTTSKPM